MVILLHIMSLGGAMGACEKGTLHYYISMILYVSSFCAVNCFGLVSGYLLYNRRFKSARIISLWIQVVFYGIVAVLVSSFFVPDSIGIKEVVESFFPITSGTYWYVSSYIGVLFFMPFINKLISVLSYKQMKVLICIIIVLFCGINLFSDAFNLQNGYGILWIMSLYFIGAYISKKPIRKDIDKKWFAFFAIILIVVLGISQPFINIVVNDIIGIRVSSVLFLVYTSPLVLGIAVSLLLFFSRCNFSGVFAKILSKLAPFTLASFVIHVQPQVMKYLFEDKFSFAVKYSLPIYFVIVVFSAILIFLIAALSEKIRLLIFRWFKLDKAIKKLCGRIDENIELLI